MGVGTSVPKWWVSKPMRIGRINNIVYTSTKVEENLSIDKSVRISDPKIRIV